MPDECNLPNPIAADTVASTVMERLVYPAIYFTWWSRALRGKQPAARGLTEAVPV
jgi:hypothetical protein